MSVQQPLTPELEAQAQELLTRLRSQADEDLLALARLLVSKADRDIFGDTEFQVRDIVHHLGAKALETHLAQKKRLRRLRGRLPALRTNRQVPRLPAERRPLFDRPADVRTGLLLLRPLRPGRVAVGRARRFDGAVVYASGRAARQLGGGPER